MVLVKNTLYNFDFKVFLWVVFLNVAMVKFLKYLH